MSDLRDNIIVEKSERFADRITKMYKYLSMKVYSSLPKNIPER